jgi:hypothetical protein
MNGMDTTPEDAQQPDASAQPNARGGPPGDASVPYPRPLTEQEFARRYPEAYSSLLPPPWDIPRSD